MLQMRTSVCAVENTRIANGKLQEIDLLRCKLRWDRGDRPDLDVAVEDLRAFRLEDDRAGRDGRRQGAVDPHRSVKAHHHLAVHDVDRVVAEGNQLDGVPLAGRLFVVRLLDASAGRALALRKERPLAGGIVVVQRGFVPARGFARTAIADPTA